ncbi:hypothetical protein HK097_006362 [Rhizophlyctis rosea]|uniref:Cell division cycle protein 123 homolog n=1 Tax=Rhizophlyctis rosea TaxID=64517 RepID=A0AAD5X5E0_9FUNG|nr:hypothetical protein HK097_006362 [Rhizophlyctis rosea]
MPSVTEVDPTLPARFPPITVQHILNCQFSEWHKLFASLTLKSKALPLTEDFVDYLNQDGLFLPLDSNGLPQPHYEHPTDSDHNSDGEEDDQEWKKEFEHLNAAGGADESTETSDTEDDQNIPHFPDLETSISSAIEELGGAVFPKLNWSSPKDASWIALSGTLKCTNAADVFLLLKSSDFVMHDLSQAFEHCYVGEGRVEDLPKRPETFELVLRKWYELSPSMEFRCFVRDGRLIGL